MRFSLRGKILLYTSALIVLLMALTLTIVNFQAQRVVNEQITTSLGEARRRIEVMQNARVERLTINAQLVASFPTLNGLLATRDPATVRDFLTSYQESNPQLAELLVAFEPDGRLIARTDSPGPAAIEGAAARWTSPSLRAPAAGLLESATAVYDAVCVPAQSGGTVFGFVMAGARVDSGYAVSLRGSSPGAGNTEIVLAGDRVLGSTIPEANLPWQSRGDWDSVVRGLNQLQTINVSGESYAALPFFLGSANSRVLAVVLQSRDVALAPYRRIQWQLLGVGAVMILFGVTLSSFLSRSLTRLIPRLVEGTERVAAGKFDKPIEGDSGDEIGQLARSFNSMLQGLREREAIGKFVSQSTIEAIQGNLHGMSAQGQRTTLTVFFSDIRGFTELTEKRAPEEVVKILNYCLSLQAQIVKKYGGDIDKFVGDCVVAHFYESGTNRSAMDAIQCSIEIEKALEKFNATLADGERVEVGIGLVTGEVVLGSIGSEDRRDFTAVGSNVNLASRLCGMAGAGEILLAESCYNRVKDEVPAERLAPLTVKGFSTPIPVYRITVAAKATA